MPIYEYQCKHCRHHFDCLQKISEPPTAPCPKCGKKAKRLISQTSFSLKGGGWYKDGYSSKKASSADAKESKKPEPAAPKKEKKEA